MLHTATTRILVSKVTLLLYNSSSTGEERDLTQEVEFRPTVVLVRKKLSAPSSSSSSKSPDQNNENSPAFAETYQEKIS